MDNLAVLVFIGIDLFDLLSCLRLDFSFLQLNFSDVELVLNFEDYLHVVSLQLEHLLVLIVVQSQKNIFLLFLLFLQEHIVVSRLHEVLAQRSRQYHKHNVHLLDDNSVR